MSDTNKQTEDVHADHQYAEDVMDSDDLFDLDMPLDEPEIAQEQPETENQTNEPEAESSDTSDSFQDLMDEFPNNARQESADKTSEDEQESLRSVEKDLEHLLDRNHLDDEEAHEQAHQAMDADVKIPDVSTPSETELLAESPVAEASSKKTRSGIAGSILLSLGLIAILIISLAAWLGLDAAQQQANLASVSSRLQQQVQLLKQQKKDQQQQHSRLTQQIETLEKRLNTLTQVLANKTAEQWRSSLQQKSPLHAKKTATAHIKTASPKPDNSVAQAGVEKKVPATNKIIAPAIPAIAAIPHPASVKPIVKDVVKPAIKPSATSAQLSMYEVAPGTVKGWVVNIFSVESKSAAERQIRRLKAKDIHAEYVRVKVKGKIWYRVRVSGFKDEHAAIVFKKFLKEYQGIDAWHGFLT